MLPNHYFWKSICLQQSYRAHHFEIIPIRYWWPDMYTLSVLWVTSTIFLWSNKEPVLSIFVSSQNCLRGCECNLRAGKKYQHVTTICAIVCYLLLSYVGRLFWFCTWNKYPGIFYWLLQVLRSRLVRQYWILCWIVTKPTLLRVHLPEEPKSGQFSLL